MLRPLFVCLCMSFPTVLSAQAAGFEGTIALGTTDIAGGSGIGVIDATATIPLSHRYPINLEIGTYFFGLDSKRPHETYVALAWDNAWRAGAIRPAYDQVLPSVFARSAPYLAYERAEYSRAHATVEAMRRTAVPWGLSWQHSFGQTDVALSFQNASKGGFASSSISLAYQGDGWKVAAAVEHVTGRNFAENGINAKLGARFVLGQMDVGIAWLHPQANKQPDALALDLVFPVASRLDAMAFAEVTEQGNDDAYGIAVDYKVRPNASVLLAVTGGARDPAVHLTMERRF